MARDPSRLRDDASPQGALRRALLTEGDDFSPSPEQLSRLEARLAPLFVPVPPGSVPATPPPTPPAPLAPAATWTASTVVKLAVVALTTAAVGGGGLLLWSGRDAAAPRAPATAAARDDPALAPAVRAPLREEPEPRREEPEPRREAAAPSPRQTRPAPAAKAAPRPGARASQAPPPGPLAPIEIVRSPQPPEPRPEVAAPSPEAEIAILRRAHAALRQGRPAQALELVAEHERAGGTQLVQERERIAVEALHRMGRTDAARARARRFLERFPGSSYAPRIRAIMGGEP